MCYAFDMDKETLVHALRHALQNEDAFIIEFEKLIGSGIFDTLELPSAKRKRIRVLFETLLNDSRRHYDLIEDMILKLSSA